MLGKGPARGTVQLLIEVITHLILESATVDRLNDLPLDHLCQTLSHQTFRTLIVSVYSSSDWQLFVMTTSHLRRTRLHSRIVGGVGLQFKRGWLGLFSDGTGGSGFAEIEKEQTCRPNEERKPSSLPVGGESSCHKERHRDGTRNAPFLTSRQAPLVTKGKYVGAQHPMGHQPGMPTLTAAGKTVSRQQQKWGRGKKRQGNSQDPEPYANEAPR